MPTRSLLGKADQRFQDIQTCRRLHSAGAKSIELRLCSYFLTRNFKAVPGKQSRILEVDECKQVLVRVRTLNIFTFSGLSTSAQQSTYFFFFKCKCVLILGFSVCKGRYVKKIDTINTSRPYVSLIKTSLIKLLRMDFKCSVPESLSKPGLYDQKLECFGKPLSFYENETADTKFTQSDRRQINLRFKTKVITTTNFNSPYKSKFRFEKFSSNS